MTDTPLAGETAAAAGIANSPTITRDAEVTANKLSRIAIDREIQHVKALPSSRERSLAITKLQEAVMWLGMDLKRLNDGKTCYPESYNAANVIVEPVADGLKL